MAILLALSLLMASLGTLDHEHGLFPVTGECSDLCHQVSTAAGLAPTIAKVGDVASESVFAKPRYQTTQGHGAAKSIRGPPERESWN